MNSVGTSAIDWFYKEKQKRGAETITLVINSGIYKSTSSHKCTGGKAIVFKLMRLNSKV